MYYFAVNVCFLHGIHLLFIVDKICLWGSEVQVIGEIKKKTKKNLEARKLILYWTLKEYLKSTILKVKNYFSLEHFIIYVGFSLCDFSDLQEEVTEHAYVNVLTRGDLSSLRWISSPLRHFASRDSNIRLCRVSYSSLNFRDIMLATGKLPPDAIPGTA